MPPAPSKPTISYRAKRGAQLERHRWSIIELAARAYPSRFERFNSRRAALRRAPDPRPAWPAGRCRAFVQFLNSEQRSRRSSRFYLWRHGRARPRTIRTQGEHWQSGGWAGDQPALTLTRRQNARWLCGSVALWFNRSVVSGDSGTATDVTHDPDRKGPMLRNVSASATD